MDPDKTDKVISQPSGSSPNLIQEVISDVLDREGGPVVVNDPADTGGRTQYGISERSHPEAWTDGQVTEKEAREIYLRKYVVGPGFHRIPPAYIKLQAQLIDYGVNSGPAIATQKLQVILGVGVDGILGPQTIEAIILGDPRDLNNRLVRARVEMIARLVQKVPTNIKFLTGWLNRAMDFVY